MRSPIRTIALTASLVFLTGSFAFASGSATHEPDMGKFCKPGSCESCHVDKVPTRDKHELLPCPVYHPPSWKGAKAPADGPDNIVIDKLADKYNAVNFQHKPHAGMAKMSADSCWTCHHETPAGKPFPACDTCHQKKLVRKNLNSPNLKAAYHQQCLNCHKTWSHNTKCEPCHAAKGAKAIADPYPTPKMPGKYVYDSKYKKSKVTFFHNDHISLFKIDCVECHKDTKCAQCHDTKTTKKKPVVVANHKNCFACHGKDSCETCHRKSEATTSFDHAKTGFPLTGQHAGLKCNSCHPAGKAISKLDTSCRSCHTDSSMKSFNHSGTGFPLKAYHSKVACSKCHGKNIAKIGSSCDNCHKKKWPANFDHKVTGVKLGEIHASAACTDCHANGFGKKTDCDSSGCHDKKMRFPKDKPSD
ncbi:MAG: cytochrome c3 family protein [bacterium]